MKSTKRLLTFILAFVVMISSVIVNPEAVQAAKAKNSIKFETSKVTLYAGEYSVIKPIEMWQNGTLVAKYYPTSGKWAGEKITSDIITFKSDNPSVATVSKKGTITAKKKGTANITVTSIYNKKVKGTIKVTVSKKKQNNAKITLNKTKATIAVGKTTTISAKKFTGLSNKSLQFSSSDKKVATVNSEGKVTGKKAGTATITVTSGVNKSVKAKFIVTVKTPDVVSTKHSTKGKASIILEETSVTLAPEKSFKTVKAEHSSAMSAESLAKKYKNGENGIYYTAGAIMMDNKAKYGTAQIKIKQITGLKSTAVTYKSSNPSVATVSSSGKITPKRVGTTTITVTSKEDSKIKATYKVTVKNLVTSFSFNMYTNLRKQKFNPWNEEDESQWYDWRELYPENLPLSATNRKYTLTSSNPKVIRVYGTAVAGAGYGTATLTLKSADGACVYSWKCTVTDDETTCWYDDGFGDGSSSYYE